MARAKITASGFSEPAGPKLVKAIERGYYDGVVREVGEVFTNTLNLPTRGEGEGYDPYSWFAEVQETAEAPTVDEDMA